ncbi:hypothetical protein HS088_TW01G00266 [Tripterygium wilfordii]|uniref:CRM domain-containing protein n=1 Tax=Tripterygium wilfordii TaxID=458696 RepID=A0A7J7E180_TRIWF|nr:CRM-domain containing factor CFM3A, chloroplastic/mitochondrial-like [Tripterygium wilfordii]KAF5752358.1 hypothetical protein HS088_TW01G00266 [Tripterygium wilfordii]
MALVPSRQFHPTNFLDSFQSSFSRFNGTHLLFFRYSCSIPLKKHAFYATHSTITSNSLPGQNPPRKSGHVVTNKTIKQQNPTSNVSGNNWLSNWNNPHKHNRPKSPQLALDYQNDNGGVRAGGGNGSNSTMEKIIEKLKNFGYIDDDNEMKDGVPERRIEKGSVEDILYVEEGLLPNTRGGFSKESPLGIESVFKSGGEVRFPWEKPKVKEEEEGKIWTARRERRFSVAEMTLPESELKRLRYLTFQIKNRTKVGGAGVTQEVVNKIHEKWKTSEIARVKVEGAPALDMKRMHEILERKTGGLVIWRSGASVSLYRGVSYEVPPAQRNERIHKRNGIATRPLPASNGKSTKDFARVGSSKDLHAHQPNSEATVEAEWKEDTKSLPEVKVNKEISPEVKYEDEVDKLLDGLGPRYTDWSGCDPLPVDADMLPGTVSGYQPPFRVLPYGVRPSLGLKEATDLRRLARFLPPHFALGRSRQLQGLAVAMIKLWEKSSIAKVALKRGVQLTSSERMAEDIKKLTGGMLLSRNKDFLVFYRGKDFLSREVTEALLEREKLVKSMQDEEEQARLRASALVMPNMGLNEQSRTAGTLEESLDADARWGKILDHHHKEKIMRDAKMVRHADLVRKLQKKLAFAERKLMRAERALSKVEDFLKPAEKQADTESVTDEERFMFRKLGLRMKAFLLLGRRGVFDGTVENMHLHWKYRELVKIIVKVKTFDQVKNIALALEAESGGVLVSVDKVSKGYAILVFRGKDYKRPSMLRPKNLLTKRKALARSIELQRREALLNHMSALHSKVGKLQSELEQMDIVKGGEDVELYDKLDSAYSTDEEEPEEEGDEAYLETYDVETDGEDGNIDSINNLHMQDQGTYDDENDDHDDLQHEESETEPEPSLKTYNGGNDVEDRSGDSTDNLQLKTNFPYDMLEVERENV